MHVQRLWWAFSPEDIKAVKWFWTYTFYKERKASVIRSLTHAWKHLGLSLNFGLGLKTVLHFRVYSRQCLFLQVLALGVLAACSDPLRLAFPSSAGPLPLPACQSLPESLRLFWWAVASLQPFWNPVPSQPVSTTTPKFPVMAADPGWAQDKCQAHKEMQKKETSRRRYFLASTGFLLTGQWRARLDDRGKQGWETAHVKELTNECPW